jgi:SpoIID/LytB domain protein
MSRSGSDGMRRRTGRPIRTALAAVLAVAGLGLDAATSAPSAAAATDTVTVTGHGYGHGRGMGQYGAYGYAVDHNLNYQAILDHFYGGTTLSTTDPNQAMSVLLCSVEANTNCTTPRDTGPLLITSGIAFTVEGVEFPGGTLVRIRHDGTQWQVESTPGGCSSSGATFTPFGPSADSQIDVSSTDGAPGEDRTRMLTLCNVAKVYRGSLHALRDSGVTRVVNVVPLDLYLRGVVPAESPSSWGNAAGGKGMHALRAQAVAARSYSMSGQRHPYARTCDTIACQVYNGANAEAVTTNQAIADTAGMVRRASNGAISRTEFSSSTGGWSAGGTFPAVIDEGDDVTANPNHNWSTTVPIASIEAAYPSIGRLVRFEVTSRNGLGADGGRVKSMNVVGTSGSVTVTGNDFRSRFGLKSDWFTPQDPPPPPPDQPPPPPASKVTAWYLRNGVSPGSPDIQLAYGGSPAVTITCDWDGNGTDTVGIYVAGTWYLRNSNTPGPPDVTISYGASGYQPVCGDWDGNGTDTIGVYVAGTWYVRNTNTPGSPDITVAYGYSGTVGMVGDWDGNGTDTFGVFDHGYWFLRNAVTPGPPDASIAYGGRTDVPVVADWDGNMTDTIGVYVYDTWYLRDANAGGPPTRTVRYGYGGTWPVAGNWDGVGGAGIGVTAAS